MNKVKNIKVNNNINNKETVLITGGNSGIGYEFIRMCLSEKYNVIFTVRSKEKGEDTINKLNNEFPNTNIKYLILDLNDFNSINAFIDYIKNNHMDIDHFYQNAGVYRLPHEMIGKYEINFLTNYFAPFYIINKLMDYFISLNHPVHINFIYSLTTYYYRFDMNKFNPEKQFDKTCIYAQTKHCIKNMYLYFSQKYAGKNIVFTITHPGATYTPLIEKGYNAGTLLRKMSRVFMKMFFHSAHKAAYTYRAALRYNDNNTYICPRGFLELSGLPKIKKINWKYNEVLTLKTEELLSDIL